MDMEGVERSRSSFSRSLEQRIRQESTISAGVTIANSNPNVNTHSGTGNFFNYNPITNNVFNGTMPQESATIQAVIAAALKERHVPQAVYSAQLESGCMNGTRVQVLRDIDAWITNPKAPQIFWLTGMMGSGKSAVACTVCSCTHASSLMVLGGSFFCSRSTGISAQRDVRCIVPTLAQLLARQSAEFSRALAAELTRDPDILHLKVTAQVEHLLYKPLLSLSNSTIPIVFVIDALDECGVYGASDDTESHRLVSDILEALVAFSRYPVRLPVKFLVTSRPETHIRDTPVSDPEFSKILQLHTVDKQQVSADIRFYISNRLTSGPKLCTLFTAGDVYTLSQLCDGLFIVAATALEFILSTGVDRAAVRFAMLLNSARDGPSTGITEPLDRMYALILTEAAKVGKPDTSGLPDLLHILSSLLSTRMTLSVAALAELMDLPSAHLRASMSHLHAVVHVPDDETEPGLRTLHASFGDYLFGRAPSSFRITASLGHDILARACLRMMVKRLRFNVSNSRSSYAENLSTSQSSIPLSLEYACLQWAHHVADLPEALALDEPINAIFLPRFLFWLEVLSVLKRVSRAAAMLIITSSIAKNETLSRFLRDGITFISSSREAIEMGAPHIYLSALPFAAKDSLIYQTFVPLCTGIISVETFGIDPHGGHLVMSLTGQEDEALSVAYSSNGRLLASGSSDGTVRVWDMGIGEETMAPLRSGDGPVWSVVFAPHGKSLVSGTNSGTVCIWTFLAGQTTLQRLDGHDDAVNALSLTPDGLILASASKDRTVRVWSTETGGQSAVYRDHVSGSISVAFSPDGTILVSGSDGGEFAIGSEHCTIRLRHTSTGQLMDNQLQLDMGRHSIRSISFSVDGTRIALCGFYDVRIYETRTGMLTTVLRTQSNEVLFAQSSSNGDSILTIGSCGELRLWDLLDAGDQTSSILVATEEAQVKQATFSPDGLCIASASAKCCIEIWSAGSSKPSVQPLSTRNALAYPDEIESNLVFHIKGFGQKFIVPNLRTGESRLSLLGRYMASRVGFVAISTHGHFLAAVARHDNDIETISLWDSQARSIFDLTPLSGELVALTFSPDTQWLAARTSKQLRIWNVATRVAMISHQINSGYLVLMDSWSLKFSPDSRLVAANGGMYVQLWEVGTWNKLYELEAHTSVSSIAFSCTGNHVLYEDSREVFAWSIRTEQQARAAKIYGEPTAVDIPTDDFLVTSGLIGSRLPLLDKTGIQVATLHEHPRRSSQGLLQQGRAAYCVEELPEVTECHNDEMRGANASCVESLAINGDPLAALISASMQDGWLTGPSGQRLLWVPKEYRDHVDVAPCTMPIDSTRVVIIVGDGGWHSGESWTACWRADLFDLLLQSM